MQRQGERERFKHSKFWNTMYHLALLGSWIHFGCVFHILPPLEALKMSSCSKREFNLSPTSIPLGQAAKYQAESACFLKSVPCGFLLHTYQFGFWVIIKPELPSVHVIFSQSLHHFHLLLQSSKDQEIIYICQNIFVRSVTFHFWGDTTENNITMDCFALNV